MNNTCLRCMTASAGTIIRRDYSSTTVILLVKFRPLQQMLSSVFGVASSGFRPLTKILDCCLPLKSGSFSSPVRRYCLSTPLSIFGLVGLYPTNYHSETLSLLTSFLLLHLFGTFFSRISLSFFYSGIHLSTCSQCFVMSKVILLPCTKILSFEAFDLQCLKRANSVCSEPEPNSHSYRYIYMSDFMDFSIIYPKCFHFVCSLSF